MSKRKLPAWAVVGHKRLKHIDRVVTLLEEWADALDLSDDEASRWVAAGLLHDALRDAPEDLLRDITGDASRAAEFLHGPAAAIRAEQDGEHRQDVLDAVRFHTVGCTTWNRTGKALYMADFLEPGRKFLIAQRTFVAEQVTRDFDAAFREVVRLRLEWSLLQGGELFPESVAMWNQG